MRELQLGVVGCAGEETVVGDEGWERVMRRLSSLKAMMVGAGGGGGMSLLHVEVELWWRRERRRPQSFGGDGSCEDGDAHRVVEEMLVDVVGVVGEGEHLALVHVVDADGIRIWVSTKWPMRALARLMSRIRPRSDMRATPPWARMSAGTRSIAMMAQTPASSAMRA
jgi:hypothetical protein